MIQFEDLPSTDTPITAKNLNGNFDILSNNVTRLSNKIGNINDLETTDVSNLVNAINSLIPDVLYSNPNGELGNLTLLNSIENYSYIEIFYKIRGQEYENSTKISGNNASLITHVTDTSTNQTYISLKNVTISRTNLTVDSYQEWNNIWGSTGVNAGNNDTCLITKVLGWR